MQKTKTQRRRQKANTEAKRVSRFHRDLEGGLPPKAVVGPVERLWRGGTLSDEQFWAATHFAGCFEATLPSSLLRAGSGECKIDGDQVSLDAELAIGRLRLGERYRQAVVRIRGWERIENLGPGVATVLLAAGVHKIALEEIDDKLQKRKQWSRLQLISGLWFLTDLWQADIVRARTRAIANCSTLV